MLSYKKRDICCQKHPWPGFHLPAPNASLQEAEAPSGVGRAHSLAAARAHGLLRNELWHKPSSWASSSWLQTQEPTLLRGRTWKNLLSAQAAFRRPGSAAESTSNLLSNHIMEKETNYCLFPSLPEVSFTGFILLLNPFSSETVFQLKNHFWKHLHPNDNSNKIYYTHLFVLNSTFLDGYILSIYLRNETWPEMWRISEDARADE